MGQVCCAIRSRGWGGNLWPGDRQDEKCGGWGFPLGIPRAKGRDLAPPPPARSNLGNSLDFSVDIVWRVFPFQHSLLYEGSELGFLRPLTLVFPQCYLVSQTIYPKLAKQIWHILKIVNRDIFVIVELNYNYKRIQCCRKNYPSFNSNLCSTTLLYFQIHLSDFVWVDE